MNQYSLSKKIPKDEFYQDTDWGKYFFDSAVVDKINFFESNKKLRSLEVNITGAATVGEAYSIKALIVDNRSLKNSSKLINTGTIDKWDFLWGEKRANYIKSKYLYPVVRNSELKSFNTRRYNQTKSPKIIIAGMTKGFEAVLDLNGEYLAGKSTTIVTGESKLLKMIVLLINSNLVSFWLQKKYHSRKMAGGYINIGTEIVKDIPIYTFEYADNIKSFLSILVFTQKTLFREKELKIYKIFLLYLANYCVYELYFPDLIEENNCGILQYLNDIPDIENVTKEEEKLKVIKEV